MVAFSHKNLSENFGSDTMFLRDGIVNNSKNPQDITMQRQGYIDYLEKIASMHGLPPDKLQKQLQVELGVSRSYISKIFNGDKKPNRDFLLGATLIAKFTLFEVQELLKRASEAPLYPQNLKDLVFIYCIDHELPYYQANNLFCRLNVSPLINGQHKKQKSIEIPTYENTPADNIRIETGILLKKITNLSDEDQLLQFLQNNAQKLDKKNPIEYLITCVEGHGQELAAYKKQLRSQAFDNKTIARLFNGEVAFGRDRFIVCALVGLLTPDETDQLLVYGGHSKLYPRHERDKLILEAIAKSSSLKELENTLYTKQGKPLLKINTDK